MTRGFLDSCMSKFTGHFGRHFDAGKTRANDHYRRAFRRGPEPAQGRKMFVETNRGRIGIHVEAVRGKSGYRGPHQFATQRQHRAIIAYHFQTSVGPDRHFLANRIDGANLGGQMMDTDRIQQIPSGRAVSFSSTS